MVGREMDETARRREQLIERLADRLCHDVSSSAQAIASGLDLLTEAGGPAERDEATAFLAEAVAAQMARIRYTRRAFGPPPLENRTSELQELAEALYADLRPELDWQVEPQVLGPAPSRALLVLLQIAAEALAAGGTVEVTARQDVGRATVIVEGGGPRAALREEARAGLEGADFGSGLGGRWAHGAFVAMLAEAAGGAVEVETSEGRVRLVFTAPNGA